MLGRKSTSSLIPIISASVRQEAGFSHSVTIRDHHLVCDEPVRSGGNDEGPSPQELLAAALASCTAVTMEMYAARQGWELSGVEVSAQYSPAERGSPTRFALVVRLPSSLQPEQVERLRVIAAKCPVHRTLEGEVSFDERVELI